MKVGLVIRLAFVQALQWMPSYQEIRADALRAEAGGFDSLWLYDQLLYRQEGETIGIWECWTILAALAEATQRVELGTLVVCNTFRSPAILAKMADHATRSQPLGPAHPRGLPWCAHAAPDSPLCRPVE